MNKIQFLYRLKIALAPLPEEERDAAMTYYEEFFDEAGEENEQSVIAEFGSPEELAKSIVEENNRDNPAYNKTKEGNGFSQNNAAVPNNNPNSNYQNNPNTFNNENMYGTGSFPVRENHKWSNGQIVLVIILLVLSSPIWLCVLSAIIGVIVGIVGALIGLAAAVGCCAVAFLIAGIIAVFREPPVGIMLLGMGFICSGLIPLAVYPLCKLTVKGSIAFGKWIGRMFSKITGRKEKAQ